ncbi:MAG: protein kinase [Nocardiopsaceae bacterium]|nr:protein kinase [Nocardiopsaceae bacterium]
MSDQTPARADVNPGDRVAGYLLEQQIGQGGMAVVYRAYDERLDRRVALKVLAPSLAADSAFRTRFIRESLAAATVEHPHIIPVYDAGDAGGCLFISMRYVQGGDVRSLLAGGRALPPARAWNIITQVASALDMAHSRNLVHRDVKPANMLIDDSARAVPGQASTGRANNGANGAGHDVSSSGSVADHIYLSDFGISKQAVASDLTSTGQFVGTLDYIAPEQIEGRALDGRADQYSLACAAYEMLCGVPPFGGPNVFALINAHLSEPPPSARKEQPVLAPGVDRVLAKAMDKAPGGRYASCALFAADLGRAIGLIPGSLEADGGATLAPAGDGQRERYHATEVASPALVDAGLAYAGQAPEMAVAARDELLSPQVAAAGDPGAVPPAARDQQDPPGRWWRDQPEPPDQQWPAGQRWPGDQQWPPDQQRPPEQQWQAGQQWPGGGYGQPGAYDQFQQYPTYRDPGGRGGQGPPGAPGGGGWGGGGGWPPYMPQQQPTRRSRGPVIFLIIALVIVIGAGAAVAYTVLGKNNGRQGPPVGSQGHGSTSPTSNSNATARDQAKAINTLLMNSEQSRSRWNSSVLVSVGRCHKINRDVIQIEQITHHRAVELRQASALQTDKIPNGATLKSQLVNALRISLRIDKDYLAWAHQQQRSGCATGTKSGYYRQAVSLDSRATISKAKFVGTWNPIAAKYGLTRFSAGQI